MLTILSWIPKVARMWQMFRGVAGAVGPFMPWLQTMVQRFRGAGKGNLLSAARG